MTLLRLAGRADDAPACLGFIKRLDEPDLRISGWSCQGDSLPARRAAVGCMLNRLILLTAGNEPKLAELFARAELKRGSCAARPHPPLGGLGDRRRKSPAARRALIASSAMPAKTLVFMQLFRLAPHYCDAVWPD